MSRLTPANQALEDAVAAVLRDASGFPLSTHDVAETLGARVAPWVVYPRLARLHRTGAIARMAFPDHRSVFWSSTPAKQAEQVGTAVPPPLAAAILAPLLNGAADA